MGVQPPDRALCRLEEFAMSRDAVAAEDVLDEMLARARFVDEADEEEDEGAE